MFKSQKSQLFKSQIGGLALNRRKWPEMGPEWSPGPENGPPSVSRPFSRLWDQSRGPKPPKCKPNSRSTAPGGRYVMGWVSQQQSRAARRSQDLRSAVGVRDLVARGYFIPGGASQRGGGPGSGVPCRTLSYLDSGQSPTMSQHRGYWQPYGNFSNRPYPLAQNRDTI